MDRLISMVAAAAIALGAFACSGGKNTQGDADAEDSSAELADSSVDTAPDPDAADDPDAPADVGAEDVPGDTAEEELPPEDPCDPDPGRYDGAVLTYMNPADVAWDGELFALTVQAGAMTSDGAILWGHAGNSDPKRLLVWREGPAADQVYVAWDATLVPTEGYMKEHVEGLAPGTWYHYAFFELSGDDLVSRTMVGRFRTALHGDCLAPIVISGTHGTNFNHAPYGALEITATYEPDMFFQLGDFSYNDGSETLEDFRALWHMTLTDPGYIAMLPVTGQYIVWDDHEIEDNAELYPDIEDNPWLIAAGKDAFFETTPVPRYANDSYWEVYRWGRTADVFLLDCRHERDYDASPPRYISEEQMTWLKDALLLSDAHFKIIANSVPIVNYPNPPWLMANDRWQGFPEQRQELLDFIADNSISNVWFLSGDFHTASVALVDSEPPHNHIFEVNLGPGGNKNNPLWLIYGDLTREMISPSDQFWFFYGEPNATIMWFDPIADDVRILYIDALTEEVLFDETLNWMDSP